MRERWLPVAGLVAIIVALNVLPSPVPEILSVLMLGTALVLSVFCFGVVRVVALLAAAAALGFALAETGAPWWSFTAAFCAAIFIHGRVRRRRRPAA